MKGYIKIPQSFLTGARYKGVTAEAKLLYGPMLDRTSLSQKNGWYDKEGRLYIYCTLDEVQRVIGCGHDKASKLMAELDEQKGVGLICRKKQGMGKSVRIYLSFLWVPARRPAGRKCQGKTFAAGQRSH